MRFPIHISAALLLALLLNVAAEGAFAQLVPPDSAAASGDGPDPVFELPLALTPGDFPEGVERSRTRDGRIADYTNFLLMPGDYTLEPETYIDPSCGNCEEPDTPVRATVGLRVSGVGIVIEGSPEDPGAVVLSTGAGYGILFDNCVDCVLRGVTITGGVRDEDQRATDAGIVVRNGSVRIENCIIRDNIGDSTTVSETVVGIIGIAGREGSSIEIVNNQIIRNSWDGIALYRGASASIKDNVIDGVDKARGEVIGGGRGVGIGVTWDAKARIERNLVRRYWKGIGIFVDARGEVFENVVEEILTWGIAYWDAGKGKPVARIRKNLIYDTGACGITITRSADGAPSPGNCIGNIIVRTGLDPKYDDPTTYCGQCPISVEALPEGFIVEKNIFYHNRRVECDPSFDDLQRVEFYRQAPRLLNELSSHPALGAARVFGELQEDD
jgi:hypothetical protein